MTVNLLIHYLDRRRERQRDGLQRDEGRRRSARAGYCSARNGARGPGSPRSAGKEGAAAKVEPAACPAPQATGLDYKWRIAVGVGVAGTLLSPLYAKLYS